MTGIEIISSQILVLTHGLAIDPDSASVPKKFADGMAAIIYRQYSLTAEATISAFVGGGQLNATLLIDDFNIVDAVLNVNDSVKLLKATYGVRQVIMNQGLNDMALYPMEGDKFFGKLVNEPIIIGAGEGFTFICYKNEDGVFRF